MDIFREVFIKKRAFYEEHGVAARFLILDYFTFRKMEREFNRNYNTPIGADASQPTTFDNMIIAVLPGITKDTPVHIEVA